MTKRPTESRGGVKGGTSSLFVCPLRGQGAELPCGVWGNAPIVFRALNSKEAANKGAGSEASLPVTLRSRRSAPQAALFTLLHIVAPNGRDRPSRAARKSSRTRRPAAFICLIHFAQCFSFGSMSAKYARTCSGGHASFDMCGTRNASSSSTELYANFPSV